MSFTAKWTIKIVLKIEKQIYTLDYIKLSNKHHDVIKLLEDTHPLFVKSS